MTDDIKCMSWVLTGFALLVVAVIITAPSVAGRFVYVQPGHYALLKNNNLGRNGIDYKTVYTYGRYNVGNYRSQIVFPSTIIQVAYWSGSANGNIVAFTDSGQEVGVEYVFHYRLHQHRIPEIHRKYAQAFGTYVASTVLRRLKNEAPKYSVTDWLTKRTEIQAVFYDAVVEELTALGFVDVLGPEFCYINQVNYPTQVYNTWLAAALQIQSNILVQYQQQVISVGLETDLLRTQVTANITAIQYTNQQQVSVILTNATAAATQITAQQKSFGVAGIMTATGITVPADVNRLLQVLAMQDPAVSADDKKLFVKSRQLYPTAKVVIGNVNAMVTL